MNEPIKLTNGYSLDVTLTKLLTSLAEAQDTNALVLLEKAISKAQVDEGFAKRLEDALLRGTTCQYRALFSDFGDYWARTSDVIPYYPHHDAVNKIDSEMLKIKFESVGPIPEKALIVGW